LSRIKDRAKFIWDLGGGGVAISTLRVLDEIQNRSKAWDVNGYDNEISGSLSNTPRYVEVCGQAASKEFTFGRFRSCRSYRMVLEHVSPRTGQEYLRILRKDEKALDTLKFLLPLINTGGPAIYRFRGLGRISPTSIRYAKVHQDLMDFFGDLSNYSITEIGCGYGGMASQIISGEAIASYGIVDLPEVENLAIKFVKTIVNERSNKIVRADRDAQGKIDLLLSNYAFSELTRELQDDYISRYLSRSNRGYMIYNHITPPEFNSYTARDICAMIPGAEIKEEFPKTDPTNVLIIWGHNLVS
jgi:hypothetical protein